MKGVLSEDRVSRIKEAHPLSNQQQRDSAVISDGNFHDALASCPNAFSEECSVCEPARSRRDADNPAYELGTDPRITKPSTSVPKVPREESRRAGRSQILHRLS